MADVVEWTVSLAAEPPSAPALTATRSPTPTPSPTPAPAPSPTALTAGSVAVVAALDLAMQSLQSLLRRNRALGGAAEPRRNVKGGKIVEKGA